MAGSRRGTFSMSTTRGKLRVVARNIGHMPAFTDITTVLERQFLGPLMLAIWRGVKI